MAKNNNLTDFLTNIADTIREAEGSTEPINPQNFEGRIKTLTAKGSLTADGTGITLTELPSPPFSGDYITVSGQGRITSDATKYYTIYQEGTVYLYGVYEVIATPTIAPLSTGGDQDVIGNFSFGWTGGTMGNPGTVMDIKCSEMRINYMYSSKSFWITYDDTTVYSNTTYSNIAPEVGWQLIDGVSKQSQRTIIIPNPVPVSTTSDFYKWFSQNTEKLDDWNSGSSGGSSDVINVPTGTLTITDAADKAFRIIIPEYSNGTFSTTTHQFYGDGAGDVTFENVVLNMPITWMALNLKLTQSSDFSNKFDDYVYNEGYNVTMIYNLLSTSATIETTTYDCCFAPESQVLMADGSTKAIVDVEIGDEVLTYNEVSGAQEAHEVTTLGNVKLQDFTQITMANGNTIEMNKYHPLYTTDGWKSLTRHRGMPELTANDKLLTTNGDFIDIDNIDTIKDMELKTYYTLKVANNNNFYVNGYLAQGKDKD
jgi:hypothetical protein